MPSPSAPLGMVVTPHPLATAAGVEALRAGGSAVDAAVAANAMLAVVYCNACGIGGDAFALVWDGEPPPRIQRERPLPCRALDRGGPFSGPRRDAGEGPAPDHRPRRGRRLGPAPRPIRPPLPGRCPPPRGPDRRGGIRADGDHCPFDRKPPCRRFDDAAASRLRNCRRPGRHVPPAPAGGVAARDRRRRPRRVLRAGRSVPRSPGPSRPPAE